MNISIDNNILIAIVIIILLIVIAVIYSKKRKYDSIDKYNELVADKLNTYKENQEQYNKNMEDSGIESKKDKEKFTSRLFEAIKIIRGSG